MRMLDIIHPIIINRLRNQATYLKNYILWFGSRHDLNSGDFMTVGSFVS